MDQRDFNVSGHCPPVLSSPYLLDCRAKESLELSGALEAKLDASLRAWRPADHGRQRGIGAIGVGATPTRNGIAGGLGDEVCARAGLDKIKDRLKSIDAGQACRRRALVLP
jgi:hypothetical protein